MNDAPALRHQIHFRHNQRTQPWRELAEMLAPRSMFTLDGGIADAVVAAELGRGVRARPQSSFTEIVMRARGREVRVLARPITAL